MASLRAAEGLVTVRIVRYGEDLAPGVRDLIVPIQRAEFGIEITYEDQPDLHDVAAFYRKGCGDFWVALDGREVVGSIALIDIGERRAALRKMFVKQGYRGAARGVVVDSADRPVAGARIVVVAGRSRELARSEVDGTFELRGVNADVSIEVAADA